MVPLSSTNQFFKSHGFTDYTIICRFVTHTHARFLSRLNLIPYISVMWVKI